MTFMNTKALIVIVGFLIWSVISWRWYICRIKDKCEPTIVKTETAVVLPKSDTLTLKVDTLKADTVVKSVQEFDDKTILYFQTKATHFDEDSAIDAYLVKLAKKLTVTKDTTVTIVGHTDDKGKEDMNQYLSLQRAKDVRLFLVTKGAPYNKIKINGLGESQPIINDTTPEARNKNRRVEILFNK